MSKRVVVLGGGVSGLTAAWSLARASPRLDVVLLESEERTGGWINSKKIENGGIHEVGPRSMRIRDKSGKIALALMSELGLESKLLPVGRKHKAFNRRLIYTDQYKLVELPSNLSWLYKSKPPFSKPLMRSITMEPFLKSLKDERDESVNDFFVRRFGQEIADWVINPMCRGIYAGSSNLLSVKSCFSALTRYEKEYGSVIRGALFSKPDVSGVEDNPLVKRAMKEKWMIYTLQGGLQTLTDALASAAEGVGVDLCLNTKVIGVSFENGKAEITTKEGVHSADYIISALPAPVLASVLPQDCSRISNALKSISMVTMGVVNLEFDGQVIPEQWREAFGYLVPSHQHSKILGTIFDSSTFPEFNRTDRSSTRLTIMMGGYWFKDLFGDPDDVKKEILVQTALQSLCDEVGITHQDPLYCVVNILKNCIPQYTLGHGQKIESVQSDIQSMGIPLLLLGSSYKGVSVNDCIMNSLDQTQKLVFSLNQ